MLFCLVSGLISLSSCTCFFFCFFFCTCWSHAADWAAVYAFTAVPHSFFICVPIFTSQFFSFIASVFCLFATVLQNDSVIRCSALVDLVADGNFMDSTWAHDQGPPVFVLPSPLIAHSLNRHELMTLTHITVPVSVVISGNSREELQFYLFNSSSVPIVLGHPWLSLHNPHSPLLRLLFLFLVCCRRRKWIYLKFLIFTMICGRSLVDPKPLLFLLIDHMIVLSISSRALLRLTDISSLCLHLCVRLQKSICLNLWQQV